MGLFVVATFRWLPLLDAWLLFDSSMWSLLRLLVMGRVMQELLSELTELVELLIGLDVVVDVGCWAWCAVG